MRVLRGSAMFYGFFYCLIGSGRVKEGPRRSVRVHEGLASLKDMGVSVMVWEGL